MTDQIYPEEKNKCFKSNLLKSNPLPAWSFIPKFYFGPLVWFQFSLEIWSVTFWSVSPARIFLPDFVIIVLLNRFVNLVSFVGLPSWSLPASTLAGSSYSPSSAGRSPRSERSKSGQSNLEAGSLFSERKRCRVPVRHGAKRSGQNRSRWTDSVHAEVRKTFVYF